MFIVTNLCNCHKVYTCYVGNVGIYIMLLHLAIGGFISLNMKHTLKCFVNYRDMKQVHK